ncbi:DUF1810 family protein [Myxosarcina sp. GI1(2024)]
MYSKGFSDRLHYIAQTFYLGHSTTSKYYAIKSREEAIAYLNHPVLGARLGSVDVKRQR